MLYFAFSFLLFILLQQNVDKKEKSLKREDVLMDIKEMQEDVDKWISQLISYIPDQGCQ